jgi:transposase-like protein DUF772
MFQLCDVGAACSRGSSFTRDSRPDRGRTAVVGCGVRQAVRSHGPCLDRAGVYAAGASVAGVYSIRSERQLVEQLDYNLLFRWFVGLGMDDAVWNDAVFSKNRGRLLNSEVAQQFFAAVNKQAKRFTVRWHAHPGLGLAQELAR